MPELPTLTVTQAQANRMIAAFAPSSGDTQQAVDNYLKWLANQIIAYVTEKEEQVALYEFLAQKSIKAQQAREELMPPNLVEETPPPTQ